MSQLYTPTHTLKPAGKNIDRVKELNPTQIIMAHGKILDKDVTYEIDRIFGWA